MARQAGAGLDAVDEPVDWAEQKVWIDLTRDEIKASPEYRGLGAVDRPYEERLYQHYGRTGYWV